MEQAFLSAWQKCREQAIAAGVRLRPMSPADAMKTALEALAIDKRFTPLFTDDEANEALQRLMEAGYFAI